ncbi:extensin-like [Lathyrus oleraceus]|uniref:extensin-like n=1 Tax=Pisum sativum TaxID=3888 RepID=UPI0021D09739|nr:extensin-like [Pisum sativum]
MMNETTSPSSSSSPQSPTYYVLSSDNEPFDPQSPTLAQIHAHALASQQPSQTKLEPEVTSPPPEQQNPTTSKQNQTPPPTQQPNPPTEQPIPSPSKPQPNPQPEQTTPSTSAIPTPPTSVATIPPILNIDDINPPSLSSPTSASDPETAFPTLEEVINVFAESSVDKIKSLTINSGISDDPSAVRIH